MRHQDKYRSFQELARYEREQIDYRIIVNEVRGARISVVAPHGGAIERGTSELARAIAGTDFNLYLFEGLKAQGNFASLHITSRSFDEPRCLELVSRSNIVVTVHGCTGDHQAVYIGGLNTDLKSVVDGALQAAGFTAQQDDHPFPAVDPDNICNRGITGAGIQLELTRGLRYTRPSGELAPLIRGVLFAHTC